MQNDDNAKQLIAERLHQATNVLITVKNNPSVDELSAALALTLMLNKLDKHATAVFSGAMPPAMNFLEPNKTFEHNVDSLRDFIIALDKEKADRLRYKVENDVVKIFITPYRSVITDKDLQFSQGDFNVEVIVALGVESREDLDRAITAHGRILHDATVITINNRNEQSNLGVIDWKDPATSSISEMMVGLADQLDPKMLDAQMSTALLTGIVAATDRFSNKKTTPHSMTIAAELMGAGANQQLIANNLQQTATKPEEKPVSDKIDKTPDGTAKDMADVTQKIEKTPEPSKEEDGSKGEMKVRHEKKGEKPVMPEEPKEPTAEPAPKEEKSEEPPKVDEAAGPTLSDALTELGKNKEPAEPVAQPAAAATPAPALPKIETKKEPPIVTTPAIHDERATDRPSWQRLEPPTLGGTLNATTAEVEEEKRRQEEEEGDHNNITLEHHGGSGVNVSNPFGSNTGMPTTEFGETAPTAIAPPVQPPVSAPTVSPAVAPAPAPSAPAAAPETPPHDAQADLDAARRAVSDALAEQPFNPASEPLQSVGSQPLPSESAPSTPAAAVQAPAPIPASTPAPANVPTGNSLPPLPDFNTLPPLPPVPGAAPNNVPGNGSFTPPVGGTMPQSQPLPPAQQPPTTPAPGQISSNPADPNQFQIPGQ